MTIRTVIDDSKWGIDDSRRWVCVDFLEIQKMGRVNEAPEGTPLLASRLRGVLQLDRFCFDEASGIEELRFAIRATDQLKARYRCFPATHGHRNCERRIARKIHGGSILKGEDVGLKRRRSTQER